MPAVQPDPVDDRTPLMRAACSGDLCEVLELLLSGEAVDAQDSCASKGGSLIHFPEIAYGRENMLSTNRCIQDSYGESLFRPHLRKGNGVALRRHW
jgi:hypothetical protein